MSAEHILLGFLGLAAGVGVSAGTFAFLVVIGVIPRLMGKCRGGKYTLYFENAVILGGIAGNIASIFTELTLPFGPLFLCVYGISAGIFVGCIAMSLAKILNTFPIMFRRIGLKTGLSWVVTGMALGKCAGALFYFFGGYFSTL